MRWVCGLMFSCDKKYVALITKKSKPGEEWQEDHLNGIGGKVNTVVGETYIKAMVREFGEEAGKKTKIGDWQHFARLVVPKGAVIFYRSFHEGMLEDIRTMEDEIVSIYPVADLHKHKLVPNLQWLIPMALIPSIQLATVREDYE